MTNVMKKWIFDPERFDGSCLTVMSDGMHCDYSGRTLDELRQRYGNPHLQALGRSELSKAIAAYERQLQRPFEEITREEYFRMLGELPPARTIRDGFFFGEARYATVYPLYFTRNDKYYYGLRNIIYTDAEIHAQIDSFLGSL